MPVGRPTARALPRALALATLALGCTAAPGHAPQPVAFTAVTFNAGTTPALPHDADASDGYTAARATIADAHYGNGLAWPPAVAAARRFFDRVRPEVVALQEVFPIEACASVPPEHRKGFVCEGWRPGDPGVARRVLGPDYQIACHPGRPDKCLALRRDFGRLRGCNTDLCPGGLAGTAVAGCGSGARVAGARVELAAGGALTLVSVHGTSGREPADAACRVAQFEQAFRGPGEGPAARSLVLGDFNTDPGRLAQRDPSAARLAELAAERGLRFVSAVGPGTPPTYQGLASIDHVLAGPDLHGSCVVPGLAGGPPAVLRATYFDHRPLVCAMASHPPGRP